MLFPFAAWLRLLSGQGLSPTAARTESLTFREWAEVYLEQEEVTRLRSYEDRKRKVRHLVEFFGSKLLREITPKDVEEYRRQRVQYDIVECPQCQERTGFKRCACGWERTVEGRSVSLQTINHDHTALTHMLNIARSPRFGLLSDNPASHVTKPDPRNWRDRIASQVEWTKLKQHAAPHLLRYLIVLYSLAPRRGELLKLEWPDVDMKRRKFKLREAKNGEPRVVPMTPAVYQVFTELWCERVLHTPRVFVYKGRPWKNPSTAFRAACRRAGIVHLRIHDFRHTASTNLSRADVDTMTAMSIVGHKSEQMHRRYNNISPEDLQQAASKRAVYHANTLITLADSVAVGQNATPCNISVGA